MGVRAETSEGGQTLDIGTVPDWGAVGWSRACSVGMVQPTLDGKGGMGGLAVGSPVMWAEPGSVAVFWHFQKMLAVKRAVTGG